MAKYTEIQLESAQHILAGYGRSAESIEPLDGGMANSSFLVDGALVLTALDNHTFETARTLAVLMDELASNGLPTPRPLQTLDGEFITNWNGKPVLLKRYIHGKCMQELPSALLPGVGQLLAKVHGISPQTALPEYGRRLPADWRTYLAEEHCSALLKIVSSAEAEIGQPEWSRVPMGLVHGDLFGDNLVVSGAKSLHILDWETATVDAFVLDIGMTAVGLCRRDGKIAQERLNELIEGYEGERNLSPMERLLVEPAIRYANAVLAFHRYYRHNVRYPSPVNKNLYVELVEFGMSLIPPTA